MHLLMPSANVVLVFLLKKKKKPFRQPPGNFN